MALEGSTDSRRDRASRAKETRYDHRRKIRRIRCCLGRLRARLRHYAGLNGRPAPNSCPYSGHMRHELPKI
jgi:hypothetical protein